MDEFIKNGFDAAVKKVANSDQIIWIGDSLHILKLARKYIIKGNMTIHNHLGNSFDNCSFEFILHLGLPLQDISDLSFMKDIYPIKIFYIKNLKKLYDEGIYEKLVYSLPFSLWMEAIMSSSLKKSARLYLLKTSFYILYYFYYQNLNGNFEEGLTSYITENSKEQFLNMLFISKDV